MSHLSPSELILNDDGSIYHLNLLPEELADTIILVGDPARVTRVSKYFNHIECKKSKREFVTHTGYIGTHRLSVIGTGIGAGNIDIVINECDALANIDLQKRAIKSNIKRLTFIRLGTCGALQENIPVDSYIVSEYAIGLNGLMHFYEKAESTDEKTLLAIFQKQFLATPIVGQINVAAGARRFIDLFRKQKASISGITITCPGFYAPQHRMLRAPLSNMDVLSIARDIQFKNLFVTNFEMETAAIYGLSRVFNHDACSISLVVANRITKQISTGMDTAMDQLIQRSLETIDAT